MATTIEDHRAALTAAMDRYADGDASAFGETTNRIIEKYGVPVPAVFPAGRGPLQTPVPLTTPAPSPSPSLTPISSPGASAAPAPSATPAP